MNDVRPKGARAAVLGMALVGCAESVPPKPAPAAPVILPPPAVKTVIRRVADGWLKPDSPFVVVLSRPVDPVPEVLSLVDEAGTRIDGATAWLAPQVVAFYPNEPLAGGLDLHLRLVAPLRAKDGSTLSPAEIATVATRTREASAYTSIGRIEPVGSIQLDLDHGQRPPVSELESLLALSDGDGPVPFVALDKGEPCTSRPKRRSVPGHPSPSA